MNVHTFRFRFPKEDADLSQLHVREVELMHYVRDKDLDTFNECMKMLPRRDGKREKHNTLDG